MNDDNKNMQDDDYTGLMTLVITEADVIHYAEEFARFVNPTTGEVKASKLPDILMALGENIIEMAILVLSAAKK